MDFLNRDSAAMKSLMAASSLSVALDYRPEGPCGVAVCGMATAYVPLAGIIDLEAECRKLRKQEDEISKHMESIRRKLSNQSFVEHAPKEVVEKEREKIAESEGRLARVREQLAAFGG